VSKISAMLHILLQRGEREQREVDVRGQQLGSRVKVDNMTELEWMGLYKHPTRPYLDNIAHRIVEVGTGNRENQFKTKGDNSPEEGAI